MSNAAIFIGVVTVLASVVALIFVLRRRRDASGARPEPPEVSAFDDATFRARGVYRIEAGRRIAAIRPYRERAGAGLEQARNAIEALERAG